MTESEYRKVYIYLIYCRDGELSTPEDLLLSMTVE